MDTLLALPLGSDQDPLPTRRADIDLTPVSLVLGNPIMCYPNSPLEFQQSNGKPKNSVSSATGQTFKGDLVAAVQPNIQAELQDAKVGLGSICSLTVITPRLCPRPSQAWSAHMIWMHCVMPVCIAVLS